LYRFVTEVDEADPRFSGKFPTVGRNKYPDLPEELRPTVEEYMKTCESVGQIILQGMAVGLGLDANYFRRNYTEEPSLALQTGYYPPHSMTDSPDLFTEESWGVGEHCDYGLLTMIAQDDVGGLQIQTRCGKWIDAIPIPGTFICNIGDMLDKLTGGVYRSTLHRVKNLNSTASRLSAIFFLDPNPFSVIQPLPHCISEDNTHVRWDLLDLQEVSGTFGEYAKYKYGKIY